MSEPVAAGELPSVFFYISGHGFGHSTRQIATINALLEIAPADLRLVVRTSAPAWLFDRTVRGPITLEYAETDTGVVQVDGLHLSERDTIERARTFYAELPARASQEARLLEANDARLVIADAPPLACAAATAAHVPSVVCSNFTWDWIYRSYEDAAPGVAQLVAAVQRGYEGAEAGWRLPMHGGFESFGTIVDLPFIARHSSPHRTAAEIRELLGLPGIGRLALVSFGGYGVRDLPMERLDCTDAWSVVLTAPGAHLDGLPPRIQGVAEELIYERGLRYEDRVRAVDVVISKPGYGIVSDCIANDTALLYTSRGRFAEYDVLVREMPRFLRCQYLQLDDFFGGRWTAALEALALKAPAPERPRTDGAEIAARMISQRVRR